MKNSNETNSKNVAEIEADTKKLTKNNGNVETKILRTVTGLNLKTRRTNKNIGTVCKGI